jgi:hypothetical protein
MKTTYKNLQCVALSTALFLCLALTATAQKDGHSSGGGSSSGSSASPRPSGGGGNSGGGAVRSSGGGSFSSRLNNNGGNAQPQRQNFGNRQGTTGVVNRGTRVGTLNGQGAAIRGNFGVTQRQNGVAPNTANRFSGGSNYRTAPGVGYGRARVNGSGFWGTHNYNYHNRGYYKSYYAPRLGFGIRALPYGYYPFFYGDAQFYYSDGLYYQYDNDQYTVVEPPIGAELTTLPDKAQAITINGQQYYELDGVYYMPYTKDDGTVVYQVAGKDGELNTNTGAQDDQQQQGPQMGDVVTQLPPDCRKISVNGQKLYVTQDGVYYQEQTDGNGNKVYKIVGLPSDEPEQN